MTGAVRSGVAPAYLFLCLVMGGGTAGVWRNLILQLVGIAIIAWAAMERPNAPLPRSARQLAVIALAAFVWIVLQLIPLPPDIWSAIPGRDFLIEGYRALGVKQLPWLPISLTPQATLSAPLSLIPPLAVMAAILRLQAYRTSWLAVALIAGLVLGTLLGALQVSTSPSTRWYLFDFANFGQATGFFANKNHMATLLLATIPFLAALVARGMGGAVKPHRYYPLLAVSAGIGLIIVVGLVLNRSLAGWSLALPVFVASSLIVLKGRAANVRGGVLVAAAALAAGAMLLFFVRPVHERLGTQAETSVETRTEIFANSARATAEFAPVGSGLGSFVEVYRLFEDPAEVDRTYINHAHNDYLELVLETGIPGLVLILLFLAWWLRLAVLQWRGAADAYGRAASIATAAILVHSLVDYPLRTSAIAAVFAMGLALMTQPRAGSASHARRDLREARHLDLR